MKRLLAEFEQLDTVSLKEKNTRMISKNFEPKEMLAFSQLRTLNQKELLNSLDQNEKIGIVIKDRLQAAIISMETYLELVEAVQNYSRLLVWLEEEELSKRYLNRLNDDPAAYHELPEGISLWDWTGSQSKG